MRKNKIKLYTQTTSSECGLCCIAMVADYYGHSKPISYYRNLFRVGRDGIGIDQMYLLFKKIELEPTAFSLKNLDTFQFNSNPYVMLTNFNHYIVVQKVRNYFLVWDPSSGKQKLSAKELEAINGGIILDVRPGENFKKDKEKLNDYRHVKGFFSNVKILFILLLFFSLVAYLVSISVPLLLEKLIDSLVSNHGLKLNEVIKYLLAAVFLCI